MGSSPTGRLFSFSKMSLKNLFTQHNTLQLVRYFLIGIFGTAVNLGLLTLLVEFFQQSYLPSAIIASFCSISVSFYFQKHWTFKNKSPHYKKQYFLYVLVLITSLLLNLGLLAFFVELLGLWYLFAQTIAIAVAGLNSFLWNKFHTFK